jgi:hypothetical protein
VTDIRRAALRAMLSRIDVFEAMRRCGVRDAVRDALADTWERRARSFEWARPRVGDFNGAATAAELEERDRRCADVALACRRHALLIGSGFFNE